MSESPDQSDGANGDPEAAMRAMMGFSSFSERRPKHQSHTSATNAPAVETQSGKTAPGVPGSSDLSRSSHLQGVEFESGSSKTPGHEEHPSTLDQSTPLPAPPLPHQQPQTNYAFVSPETGISFTPEELEELSRGKINARGDRVFFKPAFVADDPWFRLRRTGKGRRQLWQQYGDGNGEGERFLEKLSSTLD
ncbi:hypothetical protein Z517_07315 [Fonsecaea pedrosoi CBS 271.37]|uniref:Uncharacterized protein n=1 Tax=Fonsecaea pedrosoi CBS 271.37 TaxID=1442368 RepID=A0A0D2H7R0_9EURO|nr:uncharacterized protein Z517_07315 [Fonsecaea pedrosoi CBS 271.37]KIW80699.1 hypothetical protein Z517_07315 [Fonsecaea pedrosoi CBS 271.37]